MNAETIGPGLPDLTVPQVAERIAERIGADCFPVRTVYDLVRRGEIGHRRIGGRISVPQADLHAYLQHSYVPARTDTDTPGELAS